MQRGVISMPIIYISNKPQYLKNEVRYGEVVNANLQHFKISLK